MELVIHMPAIVTVIIALPLDQILEAIISHSTVNDRFDLIFICTVNECWWWRKGKSMSWDGVWESNGEFDNRKDRMKPLKLTRLLRYCLLATLFST
jgi:hypothetical protein